MEDGTILEELLTPTQIYVKPVLKLAKKVKVKGLAHMTGGGLLNLLRLNPKMGFEITDWPPVREIFQRIQEAGQISDDEMYKTFNMGIGFCLVVQPAMLNRAMEILKDEKPIVLGKAVKGHKIIFKEMEFTE
jgi:phosphoribosylformylglycinamidine cyclo-ligase